jgi:signal peptidase I
MTQLIPAPNAASLERPRAGGALIKVLIYLGSSVGLLLVAAIFMFFRSVKSFELRAFRVPSDSMCPTICLNERLIAGMDVFNRRPTERGEVILFDHVTVGQNLLKRVVAVGGDTVAAGPANTILVNGKTFKWPRLCGEPLRDAAFSSEGVKFQPMTVPKDSFFVVGDNLDQSLDSRYPDFGFVRRDLVRGKALFIYWSSGKSRIGCPIR